MIAYLKGKLVSKSPTEVIVEVNNVGYRLGISLFTFEQLGKVGETIEIFTYTYVREDALRLYGFTAKKEKEIFLMLINISGIGPKLALTILSGVSPDKLKTAIVNEDVGLLTAIAGIGKKTAQRLIVELKERLTAILPKAADWEKKDYLLRNEAANALVTLGYKRNQSIKAVDRVLPKLEKDVTLEELIKKALERI
ncbi:MAG: Holliday junction branch migration protein RuvA [bacterium (Candidatus Ratteibacteria) CG_4_10_14_3_um_filter_41_18]|uniref:Holliday junction branch migration complex subunit RuvA n=4 Tax=Candidatus Ratteibacteria TaxID=2979319 RepID=A0A2M7YGA4_9BACT|nr:MAG: Holliday junction DNA helicase RuvA [Candidatus Omnitrophica bacterium CG1_02_41_171]PIV63466.1 MAG: Holliday junction branch migration protein RuvA [bacterium (Candidatus Ratteibacteria) CG01_land_8_20_14_3_00_40_19]PIW34094.1 MAG: Holliday junction branch migration protein RuvA [bacterium (Candidatus Ratteibacteria) CG15_BIG_FIL_POST_REV_8_21_14_020_41_12]PIW73976.1 MAG: Holliday junction branch migration protein RuvA [bacterium (Candidatus Ratteibacteria) CG_4_8_14_3_um_filter_41_36]